MQRLDAIYRIACRAIFNLREIQTALYWKFRGKTIFDPQCYVLLSLYTQSRKWLVVQDESRSTFQFRALIYMYIHIYIGARGRAGIFRMKSRCCCSEEYRIGLIRRVWGSWHFHTNSSSWCAFFFRSTVLYIRPIDKLRSMVGAEYTGYVTRAQVKNGMCARVYSAASRFRFSRVEMKF